MLTTKFTSASRTPSHNRRTRRRGTTTLTTAALLSSALLLTSCGLNTQDNNASPTSSAETQFEEAIDRFNQAESDQPNPHEITGVTHAPEVGDVVPITDSAQPQLPVTMTDSDDHEVTITNVDRILPLDLYGTISRTVAGLGLRENIIGRTVSSEEPSLQDLPVVTEGSHNLNVEAILNLKPSLVLVDHSIGPADAIDQIRNAGVTVVVLDPSRKMSDIGADITAVAQAVGLPTEGKQLADRAEKERDEAIEAVKNVAPEKPMTMAFIYARGNGGIFFILGPDSGTSDLFSAIGATDVADQAGITDMKPANAESLAELNPEALVMMDKGLESAGGVEGVLARPGVAQTTAGKHQRIIAVPDSQSLSFGPQTGEMILAFAQAAYSQQ